jgi:L-glyceraldehyde 3-phosphate reductase
MTERNISPEYLETARALNEIARGRGQTLAQLALTWVLRHPEVTSALIGALSVAQLEDSLRATTAAPLTADELAAIEPLAREGVGQA